MQKVTRPMRSAENTSGKVPLLDRISSCLSVSEGSTVRTAAHSKGLTLSEYVRAVVVPVAEKEVKTATAADTAGKAA